jgi:hypothetical protein
MTTRTDVAPATTAPDFDRVVALLRATDPDSSEVASTVVLRAGWRVLVGTLDTRVYGGRLASIFAIATRASLRDKLASNGMPVRDVVARLTLHSLWTGLAVLLARRQPAHEAAVCSDLVTTLVELHATLSGESPTCCIVCDQLHAKLLRVGVTYDMLGR